MKALWFAVIAVVLVGCFTPESAGLREEKYSTAEQKLSVCGSDCAPPTYNGSPVACASNIYCASDAAGAYCLNNDGSWTTVSCTAAPSVPCGNGICGPGESSSNCPQDCGGCGNGVCGPGETYNNCPSDCSSCGNGICDGNDTRWNCPDDCGQPCPSCVPE